MIEDFYKIKKEIETLYKEKDIENENFFDLVKYFEPYIKEFYDITSESLINEEWCNKRLIENNGYQFDFYPLYQDKLEKRNFKNNEEKKLNDIVMYGRNFLLSLSNNNKIYTRGLCVYTSRKIEKYYKENNEVDIKVINTLRDLGIPANYHSFVLATIKDKKYIIDCTYSQFLSLFNISLDAMKVLVNNNAMPAWFLTTNQKRLTLLNKILKDSWFEVTDENLKMYLDSFILASRNANYYLKNYESMIDTNINPNFYTNIIDDFVDMINNEKMDYDEYSIMEYAKGMKIRYNPDFGDVNTTATLLKNDLELIDKKIEVNKELIKVRRNNIK